MVTSTCDTATFYSIRAKRGHCILSAWKGCTQNRKQNTANRTKETKHIRLPHPTPTPTRKKTCCEVPVITRVLVLYITHERSVRSTCTECAKSARVTTVFVNYRLLIDSDKTPERSSRLLVSRGGVRSQRPWRDEQRCRLGLVATRFCYSLE